MTDGNRQHPTRIVAIRPGALGDTLLVLPALALLRRARPDAHITLVARRDVLPLARAWGLADAVSPYDAPEWSALFAAAPPADSSLRAILAGSAVLAWLADHDGLVAANLRALGAIRVASGPGRPRENIQTHAALQLAAPLAALGIPVPTDIAALSCALPPLRLPPIAMTDSAPSAGDARASAGRPPAVHESPASHQPAPLSLRSLRGGARGVASDHREVERAPSEAEGPGERTLVALHAGSGGAAKRWPPERFAALAGKLARLNLHPVLIEGPQDSEVTSAVLAEVVRRGTELTLARGLDVLDLARLLTECIAYIGNDSGVSHLAGLLGIPTLALFGPTDPAIWSPLGPHTRMLRSPTGALADLPITSVAALLQQMLP